MKKIIFIVLVLILLGVIGIGSWGYAKAQGVKKQAEQLSAITSSTFILMPIAATASAIEIKDWQTYAEKSLTTKDSLAGISNLPTSLQDKLTVFFSAQAEDKLKEATYLQFLLDGQGKLGLANNSDAKSKGQIETILGELNNLEQNLNQSGLSLGPKFDPYLKKLPAETANFKNNLVSAHDKMGYNDPSVQIDTTALNNMVIELSQALTKSLNDQVTLQNSIQAEITNMSKTKWVNPFITK